MRNDYERDVTLTECDCCCCESEHYHHGRGFRAYGRSRGLAILERRYARGEIERDEYLQKRQDLASGA